MTVAERLRRISGGEAAGPLLILFGLNLVDEFDRVAFAVLTPEIRSAFGLSDTGIGAIGVIAGIFVLTAALPIGVVADRFNRVRLATLAALLWGSMSVLTGVVPTVALLIAVRLLSGTGRVVNEVIHPSLLADYYSPDNHPRVFLIHRMANPASAVVAIAAGGIAAVGGWQWAFIVLAAPTFLLLAGVIRLREPHRGASLDAALAAQMAREGTSIPFRESRRILFAVRTLRRLWFGAFILGAGLLSVAQLTALFFEQVYGFGPFERGVTGFVSGAGSIVGLVAGGQLATRTVATGRLGQLGSLIGLGIAVFGLGLAVMAVSPVAWMSVAALFVLMAGLGAYQPAFYSLVGRVAPPWVRSQAFAWTILFAGAGGFGGILLFQLAEAQGYRVGIAVLGALVAFAGFVASTAAGFVDRDVTQATDAMAVALYLRNELQKADESSVLTCRGVEAAYDGVHVLFGIDLEVRAGELVALLGTNGAGKSTLLNCVSGVLDPVGGAIFLGGRDITHSDAEQTARLGIAQVPGGRAVFPTLTVDDHFRAAGWLVRDDPERVARATVDVLTLFPALAARRNELAGNLSGGEQQMLALGMAFIGRPQLLMIDELSLGLAPTIVEQLLEVVRRIQEDGTAILLVEQSINVALTVADRAYFLEKGEVRFDGPTSELLDRDDVARSVFLSPTTAPASGRSERGRGGPERPDQAASATLLEVRGLSKQFGGVTAVDTVDLNLSAGETLGVIGPNGAGKTTLFDLVSGHLSPDAGQVQLDGHDLTRLGPDARARLGLGRSFQDARLFPSLTVAENIALSLERHLPHRDPIASTLRLPEMVRQEEDIAWTVGDLIEMFNLEAFRDKFVRELSTGSRRIVDIAMCVAHDPSVLLLDEPSAGIAQRETEALGPLLVNLQEETGCALLVIEHDLPLVTSISDRLLALDLGSVICSGLPDEVTSNHHVVTAYLGGDPAAIQRSGLRAYTEDEASEPDAPKSPQSGTRR